MIKNMKDIIKLIICLLCFFSFGYIVSFILKLFGITTSNLSGLWMMVLEVVLAIIIFSLIFVIYFKDVKRDFKEFKKDLNKNITYIVKMFFIFMIVKYLVGLISALIMMGIGYETEAMTSVNQSTIENFVKKFPWIMVFTTSILAPLYEEILLR